MTEEYPITFQGDLPAIELNDPTEGLIIGVGEVIVGFCDDAPGRMAAIRKYKNDGILVRHQDNYYAGVVVVNNNGEPDIVVSNGKIMVTFIVKFIFPR